MKGCLPAGVQGLFFNDEFGDVYGVIYTLQADGFRYAEVKVFADDVRQQLLRVALASRTILSDTTVGQFRETDKLIDIVLR